MRLRLLCVCASLIALCDASHTLRAMPQDSTAAGDAVLRPGDQLRITVLNQQDLSGDFEVAPDGTLRNPAYDTLHVAGIPARLLKSRIEGFLQTRYKAPRVTAEPLFRIMVTGAVRTPGVYQLAPDATISEAVLRAGGVGSDGRLDRVAVYRDGHKRIVDASRPDTQGSELTVRSGDQIVVSEHGDSIVRTLLVPSVSIAASLVAMVSLFRR